MQTLLLTSSFLALRSRIALALKVVGVSAFGGPRNISTRSYSYASAPMPVAAVEDTHRSESLENFTCVTGSDAVKVYGDSPNVFLDRRVILRALRPQRLLFRF
ncbi:hypothetical protein C8R47DRAFT_758212 [Mycena vitilis]|nr:hypothetical protein C8R47DRAFT_758212 [Mycena vitilis]